MSIEEHYLDLIDQVFDGEKGKAVRDKILKDFEKVTNGVAEAMPLIESAAIANLLREPLPDNNEDDAELQRRQEVVEVANELFTRCTMKDWYLELIKHGKTKKIYLEWIFGWAENFVYTREKYLKEGKL